MTEVQAPKPSTHVFLPVIICIALALATVAIYWNVQDFHFISFDDDVYVYANPQTLGGINGSSLLWAFTSLEVCNWHPLTWLSHMVDVDLFALWAGGHHLTNVFIHILNTILLFLLFAKASGDTWKSAFIAALFALHPMHVESVAWISERKDVLSFFFMLLSLHAFRLYYARGQNTLYYIVALAMFLFAVMSKPIAVILPVLLIAFDIWPLKRLHSNTQPFWKELWKLLLEKIPFFILSAVTSIIAVLAQQRGGAVTHIEHFAFIDRIAHGMVSYILYIYKMVYPVHLGFYYLYDTHTPILYFIGAVALLLVITIFGLRRISFIPWFASGWIIYLAALLPVIGFVQVGSQAMADRYSYISMIGIAIVFVYGIDSLLQNKRTLRIIAGVLSVTLLSIYGLLAHSQVQVWENNNTLYGNTLKFEPHHPIVNNNYGTHFLMTGEPSLALPYFKEAIRVAPRYALAYYNAGLSFQMMERVDSAMHYYKKSLVIAPSYTDALLNAGAASIELGDYPAANEYLVHALSLAPASGSVYYFLGKLNREQGNPSDAEAYLRNAMQLVPESWEPFYEFALLLRDRGELPSAKEIFHHARTLGCPDSLYAAGVSGLSAPVPGTQRDTLHTTP